MKEDQSENERKQLLLNLKERISRGERDSTEIKEIIDDGAKAGVIDQTEADILINIFEFSDKQANDVMVHRSNISAVDGESTIEEAFNKTMENGFSRYPVYVDDLDQIVGIFHIRDLVKVYADPIYRDKTLLEMRDRVIIDAYSIPETRNIDRLFREMQVKKIHMAIVVDEYGQTAGLVTMEDIIEEIFGNIWDEHDKPEVGIVKNADGSYNVAGSALLDDVADTLNCQFDLDEIDTMNGFMTSKLGHIPEPSETFETIYNGYLFKILEVRNRVVSKVKAIPIDRK